MKIKVAGVQPISEYGNVKANLQKAEKYIRDAVEKGCKMICFPELYNTGYFVNKEQLNEISELSTGSTSQFLSKLAKELDIVILMGYPEKVIDTQCIYNSVMVIDATGENLGTYRKTYLWGDADRMLYATNESNNFPVFKTKYGTIGVLICFDMDFTETFLPLAFKGAELIFVPSAWSFNCYFKWNSLLQAGALRTLSYVFGVNFAKDDTLGYNFSGATALYNPRGEKMVEAETHEKEELVFAEIDFEVVRQERATGYPMYRDFKYNIFQQINDIIQKTSIK